MPVAVTTLLFDPFVIKSETSTEIASAATSIPVPAPTANETAPVVPPPVKPSPAVTPVISPTVGVAKVTAPEPSVVKTWFADPSDVGSV